MGPPGHGGGRIHVHQRITDDACDNATPIIGADLDLGDYKQVTHETFSRQLDIGTRKDYRRRIQRIIDFWKKQCPEYINAGGVLDVSAEDQQDETKYFFKGRFKQDIQYRGIRVEFVIRALAFIRKKEGGRLKTHGDIRKYSDAIKWAAGIQQSALPSSYHVEIEKFLKSYKREAAVAKGHGLVDEKAADPITLPLYHLLLKWSL